LGKSNKLITSISGAFLAAVVIVKLVSSLFDREILFEISLFRMKFIIKKMKIIDRIKGSE
jgi:hypothetical protein